MDKLLEIINTVLENRGKATVDAISESSSLKDDLGFDSLDLAELTVRVEAEYDVDIFEDGVVTTVGEILGKVVAGVSAIAQGTAMLSLSEETRPMRGGFILKDQNVEVNCTFETLVRLQRAETAGAVAKKLFG